MSKTRYDVIHIGKGPIPTIDIHFCREMWYNPETNELDGCFGFAPNHGFSWEEAKQIVIRTLEKELVRWRAMTEDEYFGDMHHENDD